MRIIRMTATFGRLNNETLVLTPGLNVIELPNEGGKSTWAEFLLAMLYGVDTAERERGGVLPVKTKYQPWSGEAMAGVLELEQDGRRITITRTSTARAPMGVFSAVYTDTGLPVERLTGANCGETLLGVPKRVYQRSAFVRQQGLALTPDDALESRLSALVTTGEETVSYRQTAKRLRDWQNRRQYNKTGRIPETERALAAADDALAQLRAAQEKNRSLRETGQRLQAELAACEQTEQALRAIDAQQKRQQLYDARRAALAASNRENAAAALCARLPDEAVLRSLQQQAQQLLHEPEPQPPAPAPARPACPAPFTGVEEDRLLDRAQRDMREFDRLTARKYRAWAPFALFAFVFAAQAAAVLLLQKPPLFAAAFAGLAVLCIPAVLLCVRSNRTRERELDEAQAILARYGGRSRDEFAVLAAEYRAALTQWRAQTAQHDALQAQYDAAMQLQKTRTASLLGSARMFSDAEGLPGAAAAIDRALGDYAAHHAAQLAAAQAKDHASALGRALGTLPDIAVPAGDYSGVTAQQAQAQTLRTRQALGAVQSQLDQCRGQLQSLGSEAELAARQQMLTERLQTLRMQQAALVLAAKTMEEENEKLEKKFAPRLIAEASELFRSLTDGKYQTVTVDRQMNLQAAQPDAAPHGTAFLSCGTADGSYFCVRLAICKLLLPAGAPVVLDDALAMLDETRLRRALELLKTRTDGRQILLFTCHKREQMLLQNMG